MNKKIKNINVIFGSNNFDEISNMKPFSSFDNKVTGFLDKFSKTLMSEPNIRDYPEVASLGFFCRSANIKKIKRNYPDSRYLIGRGLAFHICPSNVPVNFGYSMVAALLSGCRSILKVSSKEFIQVDIICNALKKASNERKYSFIKSFISIIRYNNEKEINTYLSKKCNVRIIWGGDETVSKVREEGIKPNTTELTFPNKNSILVIDTKNYLKIKDKIKIAKDFYNDTYLYDQNACTSPRLVYWLGNKSEVENAKSIFWEELNKIIINRKYDLETKIILNKHYNISEVGIELESVKIKNFNNFLSIATLKTLDRDIEKYFKGAGLFFEYSDSKIDHLNNFISDRIQTVSYVGFSEKQLFDMFIKNPNFGIDRIVPVGRTGEFSLKWDGFDLIRHMTREINLK